MKAGETAEISIFDEIGMWGVTAKNFIDELNTISAKQITLSINSPGGSVFDAIAIYNALRKKDAKVTCRVLGVAASAASLIAMAGDKIVMPENTFMMIHNPMSGCHGNADDMRELADVLDKIGASIVALYAARTGKTEDEVKSLLANDTWLTAAEAVELGFADEMEDVLKIAASFEIDRLPENIQNAFTNAVVQTTVTTTTWTEDDKSEDDKPEGDPMEPPTAFADTVVASLKASGLDAYATEFVLSVADKPALDAAIANALEVKALCAVAGKPDDAGKHIRARTPVADVRAALMAALAQADEDSQTDGAQPSGSSTQGTEKPTASVTTASIWASRRH